MASFTKALPAWLTVFGRWAWGSLAGSVLLLMIGARQ